MQYPVTSALVEHFLAGLAETETREIKLVDRLRAVIATLPKEAQRSLSVTSVLANVATDPGIPNAVRKLIANPAFKAEPIIAQLRRAEAVYIEAHDGHRAAPESAICLKELEWAQVRHAIAARFYAEMVIALPPAKRPVSDRPMVRSRAAAIPLRLADFSADEQRALRQAAINKEIALTQLDDIIHSKRASGPRVNVIHAYLVDPDNAAMFDRWLTDELARIRSSPIEVEVDASEIEEEHQGICHVVEPAPLRSRDGVGNSVLVPDDEGPPPMDPPIDDETVRDIATVKAFCAKQGWAIVTLGEGRYGLKSGITRMDIVNAFERARNHPAMQDALRALAGRTAA